MTGSLEFSPLILLAVILAGPVVAKRFKIPGLIGLIFFGMFVGGLLFVPAFLVSIGLARGQCGSPTRREHDAGVLWAVGRDMSL